MRVGVVIPLCGNSQRFNNKNNNQLSKQFFNIGGENSNFCILSQTLYSIINTGIELMFIRCVILEKDIERYNNALSPLGIRSKRYLINPIVCKNTESRHQSVKLGIESLEEMKPDCVIVHDANRPQVSKGLFNNVILSTITTRKTTIPVIPISDSLVEIEYGENKNIISSKNRSRENMYKIQTPQGFMYKDIMSVLKNGNEYKHCTDESSIMLECGYKINYISGDSKNIKITYFEDLNHLTHIY